MNNPLAGTDPTGYVCKCNQNPTCQMQSFFSSVGSGGSSLIGHLMGRLKTTLTNGHDTKQAKKAQEPKAAAEVKSPASVSFVLDRKANKTSGGNGGYFDGGNIAKNCQHCRFINGNEGAGGGAVPGLTHQEKMKAAEEGSEDALMIAVALAPVPSLGKLKIVEKTLEGLAKLRVAKGAIAGAEKAIIDPRKITEYVLNLSHPKGGDKARVFNSVLGITAENSGVLTNQLLRGVMQNSATLKGTTKYGTQYQVMIPVRGPKGVANVTTGWIVRTGESSPRLTSAYINTKKAF